MVCKQCQAKNPIEAAFCFQCGTPIVKPSYEPIYEPLNQELFENTAITNPNYYTPTTPANPYVAPPNGYIPPFVTGSTPQQATIASDASVVQYHPLAEGALHLPIEIQNQPQLYYSYVNSAERLIFARRSGFGNRVAAVVLDLMILSLPFTVITGLIGQIFRTNDDLIGSAAQLDPTASSLTLLVGCVMLFGYFYLTGVTSGQSIGKKMLKMRVMRLNGLKPDAWTALLRFLLGYMLSTNLLLVSLAASSVDIITGNSALGVAAGLIAFGWGFWWCGLDKLKQTWHDKLARTLVVSTHEYVEGVHFLRP